MATSSFRNGAGRDQISSGRRTLAVLETLASQPGGMTPKEISKSLGLHLSTCYRLLNTLQSAGYVVRAPDGNFTLGRRVAYLNHRYQHALRPRPAALAFLHALQLATGETSILFRLEGDDAVATAIVTGSRQGASTNEYIGLSGPACAFAAGRALLAWLPLPQRESAIARCQGAAEGPSLMRGSVQTLRDDLARIQLTGFAADLEGSAEPCSLAAPVRGKPGAASAATVVAPCARLRREQTRVLPVLLEVARAISTIDALPDDDADDPGHLLAADPVSTPPAGAILNTS